MVTSGYTKQGGKTTRSGGGGGGAIDENTTLDAGPIQSDREAEAISSALIFDVTDDVMTNQYPGNFDSALYRMDFSPTYRNPTPNMLNDRIGSGFMITLDDVNRVQRDAYRNTPSRLHAPIRQLENVGRYKLATMWNSAPPSMRRQFLDGLSAPERRWVNERMTNIGLVSQ